MGVSEVEMDIDKINWIPLPAGISIEYLISNCKSFNYYTFDKDGKKRLTSSFNGLDDKSSLRGTEPNIVLVDESLNKSIG